MNFKNLFGSKDIRHELMAEAIKINSQTPTKIVFADTTDEVLKAASIIKKKGIATPILLGEVSTLLSAMKKIGVSGVEENIVDYMSDKNNEKFLEFSREYVRMRKADGKLLSEEEAKDKMKKSSYYGAMLLHLGEAQGMISGATTENKPYYPVFEIIKLAPGVSRTSGIFLMIKGSQAYFFADCVMNMNPTAEQLAEIALLSSKTAESFGVTPRVAMLSFSTRDSAKHESVDRVKQATAILRNKNPNLIIDGEIQVDAALSESVMQKKCSDSPLLGKANVLIFPDLNSANIGYKLVEYLGGFESAGPFLQGVRLPVNDLSRGCTVDEIVYLASATVIQTKMVGEHKEEEMLGIQEKKKGNFMRMQPSAPKPTAEMKKYDPLDSLPSNVRKIIEDSRKKNKKEEPKD